MRLFSSKFVLLIFNPKTSDDWFMIRQQGSGDLYKIQIMMMVMMTTDDDDGNGSEEKDCENYDCVFLIVCFCEYIFIQLSVKR